MGNKQVKRKFMFNSPIYRQNLIFVALALSLVSVFLIFNIPSSYSQNSEISYLDVNDTSSVSKFSVAGWFKTSADYKSDAFIVNKPGSSNHMNYGIWMTNKEKISGGFETSNGKAVYATSPLSYNDGKWHYVVVTFDGSVLNLYVDGVWQDTKESSASPDNGGDNPVRVGADAGTGGDFFDGNVDEIRVYRIAWTPDEVNDAYHGKFDTKYQELYLDFSDPIMIVNATLPINQTALNQTALNQTALNQTALNQTALNQTALNQTALNQTALNQTVIPEINATITNETTIQGINGTGDNGSSIVSEPLVKNGTSNATDTEGNTTDTEGNTTDTEGNTTDTERNIQPTEPQNTNDTGVIEETGNQTSIPLEEENNSPEAFDQSVSVEQDGQIDITLVASDEDDDPLQFDVTADPLQGSIDKFDNEKGTLTYVPQQGYSGVDEFKFRVVDDKGAESNIALVDITVEELKQQSNENQDNRLANTTEDINNQSGTGQDTGINSAVAPNQNPKADAGNDLNVQVNTKVKLDGIKSLDEDGQIVSYKWEQTDGPEVDLKQSNEQTASFDVPESAANSELTFKLTVVDNNDASSSDDVTIEVQNVEENNAQQTDASQQQTDASQQQTTTNEQTSVEDQPKENVPPKADAGNDLNVQVNTKVKLDGIKSLDEDGQIVSYKWEQTDGPGVDLKQSNEQTASFDVPDSAADSKLTFKLTVVDDKGASNTDDVTIEVQNVEENNAQQTDTSQQQTDTSQQQTDTSQQQTETNEQAIVEEQPKENVPPKADAGDDQNAQVNIEVKLDGTKSSDDDGQIVSHKWEQTDGPEVDLKQSDEKTASFDVPESAADSKLTFKLTVVDDKGASNTDDVTIEVEKVEESNANAQQSDTSQQQTETNEQATVQEQPKENVPPKADAGDDQNAQVNTQVKLDGSKSSDEDGEIDSYKWEQTDGPKVDLKQSDEKTASFDVPESAADSKLTFKLTVVDDKDESNSDDATVEVEKIAENNSDTQPK